jgi:hypothetical protein
MTCARSSTERFVGRINLGAAFNPVSNRRHPAGFGVNRLERALWCPPMPPIAARTERPSVPRRPASPKEAISTNHCTLSPMREI